MRILITGASGFVGHHIVEHFIKNTDWELVLTTRDNRAGNSRRLEEVCAYDNKVKNRVTVIRHDLKDSLDSKKKHIGPVDYILHVAADSHVDYSIENPREVMLNNISSTMTVIDFALMNDVKKFIYFSTDEVYGPAPKGVFHTEEDRLNPQNPYAVSKASSELLCKSFANTHKLPLIITRTMNIFGERQDKEKFIPLVINKILNGETIQIHASPDKKVSSSRCYLHARNCADAQLFVIEHGKIGETYNVVGEREVFNDELVEIIGEIMGKKPKYELVDYHSSRPGHDLRYAMSGEKLKKLGWEMPKNFEQSLEKTIKWTLDRPDWL